MAVKKHDVSHIANMETKNKLTIRADLKVEVVAESRARRAAQPVGDGPDARVRVRHT
tara:strand:+ start:682 stop:852 length:171 start_codon:yes stop_codon:yes gene_type:complete